MTAARTAPAAREHDADARPAPVASPAALAELAAWYRRDGVLRTPDRARRADRSRTYKKGYEIRFLADSVGELVRVRALLTAAGLPVAAAYPKGRRFVQPVYGKVNVTALRLAAGAEDAAPPDRPR